MAAPVLKPLFRDAKQNPSTRAWRHAEVRASSYNEAENTIDVIWSTGADVLRYDYYERTEFVERLSMLPVHVRTARLESGAAGFLDSHDSWSVKSQLGCVREAAIENGIGTARIALSVNPDHAGVIADIKAGIIRNISVGYEVHAYTKLDEKVNGVRVYLIDDWEPLEISVVPVPADPGAYIRSLSPNSSPAREKENTMNPKDQLIFRKYCAARMVDQAVIDDMISKYDDLGKAIEAVDAANKTEETTEPPASGANASEADAAERKFKDSIDIGLRGLDPSKAAQVREHAMALAALNPGEKGREAARKYVLEARAAAVPAISGKVEVGVTHGEQVRAGMENALLHRMAPKVGLTDAGRAFRGNSLVDMARECVGGQARSMGRSQLWDAALRSQRAGEQSTSDFPGLVSNVVTKFLAEPDTDEVLNFLPFGTRRTLPDLKEVSSIRVGSVPSLVAIEEGAEYTDGYLAEAKEKWKLGKFGKKVKLTEELFINDDLDALASRLRDGQAAAIRVQKDVFWGIITANAAMADGNALFHSSHRNLADAGAPSADALGGMLAKLMDQVGVDGSTPVQLEGKFLLVPALLQYKFNQILFGQYTPTTAGGGTTPEMRQLTIVPEVRLTRASATNWYLSAGTCGIEYGYLAGEDGLVVKNQVNFDNDALEFKFKLYFGAKAADWRRMVKNPYAG